MAEDWRTDERRRSLRRAARRCAPATRLAAFLRDICSLHELETLSHRWQAARLLDQGIPTREVAERACSASTATVTRVAHWLRHGEGGYRLVLDRLDGGS